MDKGTTPLLMSVCAGILFVPFVAAPVILVGMVAVQEIFAPVVVDVKLTGADVAPEQIVWSGMEKTTVGDGLTVMVNVELGPLQVVPFNVMVGVTVNRALIGLTPLFTATNAGMLPVPFGGVNPMEAFVVQEYVVPATGELNVIAEVLVLVHTV